jgi:AcrR family transcriptional regulator
MPRITAPTLVEHRERQRAALLDAVEGIVIETGSTQVTVSAVAARAGLARSSVYEYFDSPAALLAAAVVDRMDRWSTDVAGHVSPEAAPAERIEMFIRASLVLAAKGAHRLGRVVRFSDIPPECSDALRAKHDEMTAPLTRALADAKVADPDRAADLILGVIQAASTRIDQGSSRRSEADAAVAFVMRALDLD